MIGMLLNAATGFLERRQQRKDAEHKQEMANIEAGRLERANGWKDEFVTVLWSLPFVGLFLPWTQPYVFAGFEAMGQVPEWYVYGFCTISGAAAGVTLTRKFRK